MNITWLARVAKFKRRCVERAMRKHDGNVSKAAKMLGCSRINLYVMMSRMGFHRNDFTPMLGEATPRLWHDKVGVRPQHLDINGASVACQRRRRRRNNAPTDSKPNRHYFGTDVALKRSKT